MDNGTNTPSGAPKGKYVFGTVKVGEKGQIVIPKEARDVFHIKPGDMLLLLGDEDQGIAIVKSDILHDALHEFSKQIKNAREITEE
ncbi:MAG TPA: AbrB/MazE/SpoVT family DNA-binding domain-containing protein [Oscillospiraceae bacterium]|nr:AbrB/MazE/SpoVT family DNA-binding domain-containing protein [Oscillospiraceae bacterium]HPS33967.1 AbrB/MazE/SpoVT family DNA-binding domain-containing protein [Oscillospiraceae bacterium]